MLEDKEHQEFLFDMKFAASLYFIIILISIIISLFIGGDIIYNSSFVINIILLTLSGIIIFFASLLVIKLTIKSKKIQLDNTEKFDETKIEDNLNKFYKEHDEFNIKQYINDLKSLNTKLTSKYDIDIKILINKTEEIYTLLEEYPMYTNRARRFIDYYLPETIEILNNYIKYTSDITINKDIVIFIKKLEKVYCYQYNYIKKNLDIEFDTAMKVFNNEIDIFSQSYKD